MKKKKKKERKGKKKNNEKKKEKILTTVQRNNRNLSEELVSVRGLIQTGEIMKIHNRCYRHNPTIPDEMSPFISQ